MTRALPAPQHHNAFGFIRLAMASLVIVSHTFELRDGNRGREPLTRIFHTLSFGDLAVAGFFIVSGYLITASFMQAPTWWSYVVRRSVRIYPAFLVAYVACIFIVAPLAGTIPVTLPGFAYLVALNAIFLQPPFAGLSFLGQPYPDLDGAMWTVAYEFRCYALIACLGLTGVLRRRSLVLTLTAVLLGLHILAQTAGVTVARPVLIDEPGLRLVSLFMTGACFWLFRDRIQFSRMSALGAALIAAILLWSPSLADAGIAIFGGYALITLAERAQGTVLTRINTRNDVSYGVYLYAWPIEQLVYRFWPQTPTILAGTLTLGLAYGMGWASWVLIEKPCMIAGRNWLQRITHARTASIPARTLIGTI